MKTKGEVRTQIREAKVRLKNADFDIRHGRVSNLADELDHAIAALTKVRESIDSGDIRWIASCFAVLPGGQFCGSAWTKPNGLCGEHQ